MLDLDASKKGGGVVESHEIRRYRAALGWRTMQGKDDGVLVDAYKLGRLSCKGLEGDFSELLQSLEVAENRLLDRVGKAYMEVGALIAKHEGVEGRGMVSRASKYIQANELQTAYKAHLSQMQVFQAAKLSIEKYAQNRKATSLAGTAIASDDKVIARLITHARTVKVKQTSAPSASQLNQRGERGKHATAEAKRVHDQITENMTQNQKIQQLRKEIAAHEKAERAHAEERMRKEEELAIMDMEGQEKRPRTGAE